MFGIAYRTDFDLSNHAKHSGQDLAYMDAQTGEKYIPHVVEPTFGLSRLTGVILADAFRKETVNGKERIFLKLKPFLAPVKVAVFPLQKDEKLENMAHALYKNIKSKFSAEFDNKGNIGKMYRRQDEIGTPFCITVDFESLTDGKVTVRERDTMAQKRIPVIGIQEFLAKELSVI